MLKISDLDQMAIKNSNNKAILQLLYKNKKLTKQEISKILNISIPTVTHNINALLEEGIVREAGVADSTGGRKPVVIEFIPDARYAFGAEFSDKGLRLILTNLCSDIIEDCSFYLPEKNNINAMMTTLKEEMESILHKRHIDKAKVLGIGFAVHGVVDEESLFVKLAPNINLKDFSFKMYENWFDFPIYMENESNAAALAESILGVAKSFRNMVYVSIHRGVGCGIVIQDYVYKGKNRRAGEFGHMTVMVDGKECNCGKKGCWEMYASEKALIDMRNKYANGEVCSISEVFEEYQAGKSEAVKAVQEYINYLAIGLQNILLILDPHYIILGGSISKYADLFLNELNEKVFIPNSFYSENDTRIISSTLKENAPILGASLLPLQHIFFTNNKII